MAESGFLFLGARPLPFPLLFAWALSAASVSVGFVLLCEVLLESLLALLLVVAGFSAAVFSSSEPSEEEDEEEEDDVEEVAIVFLKLSWQKSWIS